MFVRSSLCRRQHLPNIRLVLSSPFLTSCVFWCLGWPTQVRFHVWKDPAWRRHLPFSEKYHSHKCSPSQNSQRLQLSTPRDNTSANESQIACQRHLALPSLLLTEPHTQNVARTTSVYLQCSVNADPKRILWRWSRASIPSTVGFPHRRSRRTPDEKWRRWLAAPASKWKCQWKSVLRHPCCTITRLQEWRQK